MQDKVLEILAGAPGWLTASDVAEKGKFRSVANVGLCLKHLGDRVASRKSPARKNQSTGQPLVEWKHADKAFDVGSDPASTKSESIGSKVVDAPSDPITRRAPVKNFTQPAHDNEISDLRAHLKLAEQQRNDHFNRAESLERALENTDHRLGIIGTMLINVEGDGIKDKLGKVLHENVHSAQRIAELEKDVHRHSSGLQEASTAIIRFLIAAQQITGMEHRPTNMQEAEQQIAATIRLMQGRVEELEQTIHEMELAGTQGADAVDVKDAAVGYLVRVPKRKPRLCMKPESAREAALSGARVYGRADVLALVPVGKAVKSAEWREA